MKFALCIVVALGMIALNANALDPQARYHFRIEQGTLGTAMDAFVKLTNVQLLYPHELAHMTGVNPVNGVHTINEALGILLRGTDFSGDLTDGGVIVISLRQNTLLKDQEKTMERGRNNKRTLLATLIAFFATGAVTQGVMAQDVNNDGQTAKKQNQIDEIIVTAQKREERLIDVPMSISVAVWSPELDLSGNSYVGTAALAYLTSLTRSSIF